MRVAARVARCGVRLVTCTANRDAAEASSRGVLGQCAAARWCSAAGGGPAPHVPACCARFEGEGATGGSAAGRPQVRDDRAEYGRAATC